MILTDTMELENLLEFLTQLVCKNPHFDDR